MACRCRDDAPFVHSTRRYRRMIAHSRARTRRSLRRTNAQTDTRGYTAIITIECNLLRWRLALVAYQQQITLAIDDHLFLKATACIK